MLGLFYVIFAIPGSVYHIDGHGQMFLAHKEANPSQGLKPERIEVRDIRARQMRVYPFRSQAAKKDLRIQRQKTAHQMLIARRR
ncbi:hypothetical protein GCM10007863_01500 [Dyella mobilis]|nr:hypothetical protein GCM10007863_01500 [Dyella mobilis]